MSTRRKYRRRVSSIGVHVVDSRLSWRNAAVVFDQGYGKDAKRVIVRIEAPYEIARIREVLNEIEADWRKRIEHAKP